MKTTYFFHDRPLFGIDINRDSVRLMQVGSKSGKFTIKGYGSGVFDGAAIKDGAIVNPEIVAASVRSILDKGLQGSISTRRVAMSIPSTRTFSRAISLPKLSPEELKDAVLLEIEQYTPVAVDNLYLDFTTISQTDKEIEVFAVAAPKQMVESYLQVAKLLDLEPVLVETRVDSSERLFALTKFGSIPSVLIDFEIDSINITIVDRKNIIATGTVSLAPTVDKYQSKAQFELLIKEVRSMVRYYEERYDKTHQIEQIVFFGNAASLTGLASLMTDQLRLPVRSADPWQLFNYAHDLAPIPESIGSDYVVTAGLAIISPKQVWS